MKTFAAGQAPAAVRQLMAREGYAWRRAFTVLDGTAGGRILADETKSPAWCAIQEFSDDSAAFLAGALDAGIVREVIARFRQGRRVTIGTEPGDPLAALLPPADLTTVHLDFVDRDPAVALEPLIRVPDGLRLASIDASSIARCLWTPWMFDTEAMALAHGIGFCVLDGERIVSEAFAGPACASVLEMAVITARGFKGRGLAAATAAATVAACEQRGLATWWNTSLANVASAGLARKLGYRTERRYTVHSWLPA